MIEEIKKRLDKALFSCESKGDYSVCLPHINNEEIIAQEIYRLFKSSEEEAKAIIIRDEQKRNAGALRILFEKGWTLNDLIQAEDTMEEEYTNIAEEAKREERGAVIDLVINYLDTKLGYDYSGIRTGELLALKK